MKKLKSLLYASSFILLCILSFPAVAQQPGQGPGQGGRRMPTEDDIKNRVDRLAETLQMTGDQKEKIFTYEIDAFKKRQVEMQKFQGDREAMRNYMRSSFEERNKKYEEVLTKEQMEQYRQIQEQRRQQMQDRRQQQQQSPNGERPERGRGRG